MPIRNSPIFAIDPPIEPMLAKAIDMIPEGDFLYEPKWDGFRAIVFRDSSDGVQIQSRDQKIAAEWLQRFEGAGLDGVVAKPRVLRYTPGKRVMFKIKHARTADCVVAGFRWHKSGGVVGSLLLGLYDDDGDLHHVGVTS